MNELEIAVRQAINDSEGAAGSPDDLLDVQARAAVEAMVRMGWIQAHGWEYAVKRGDVTVAAGFNTLEQAQAYAPGLAGAEIVRRPVGVWEPAE
ncbi:hypothetical protein PV761_03455 [Arthrobacter sp. CC3]|uniref:hypothetical protein n=1 Tax=Arthrobacter sp. CC3 TaxID=3029185 RepID=UPI003262FE73